MEFFISRHYAFLSVKSNCLALVNVLLDYRAFWLKTAIDNYLRNFF